ncbi:MAG: polysaccharide biosynthesis transport protein [Candidatus Eremiobacteraeota bacterium]|jgi:capsular exopolysaccharide synthesis family protein|nr:polysaccharide biosynthesis transport protein [Candidatus Eremiobacteraeota bacterium]
MYEPQRLPGTSIPLATPLLQQRNVDVDPVGMWNSFVGTLTRRGKLFALVVFGVIIAVAVVTLLTPKRYTTDAKIIAGNPNSIAQNPQQAQTGLPVLNALLIGNAAQSAETYAELMGETPVVQKVIENLHLKTDVATLKAALKVKPVTNTSILSLQISWSDPATSAAIANEFATVFVARQAELMSTQANGAKDQLEKQLPPARERLRTAEQNLSRYEVTHNIADLSTQTTSTVNAAINIDSKINQVELDKRQADAQIGSLSSSLAGMTATTGGGSSTAQNPVLPTLRQKLADLTVALGSARGHYTDSHPQVINLKQQIADVNREIARTPPTILASSSTVANPVYQQTSQALSAARAMSQSASAQLSQLAKQRAAINPQIAALPGQQQHLAELKRQAASAENTFNALQQKYNDASIASTTGISDVAITQRASKELAAKTPHLALNLIIATIVGIMLGLGIVFLVDWFDGRIRDERDVEGELQLPVLASIPELPSGDGAAAIPANVRNATMESYFQLVLAMRYSSDRPLRSVTITSPLKGDGKSTVAMNVAGAFGEIAVSSIEREARVLVIDADLRRPSLHKKFEVSNELGLSDILIGRASLTQAVQRTDRPGVDVLTSGTPSPNPIKLLQSNRFDALLREARERYVTVIVDAPALVPVFDAAIVAAKTDGTVMIVAAAHTDVRSTRKALARLESVGVNDLVGTVVNRSTTKVDDYSDYFAVTSRELKELPNTA